MAATQHQAHIPHRVAIFIPPFSGGSISNNVNSLFGTKTSLQISWRLLSRRYAMKQSDFGDDAIDKFITKDSPNIVEDILGIKELSYTTTDNREYDNREEARNHQRILLGHDKE
jgi:hypothetical protein